LRMALPLLRKRRSMLGAAYLGVRQSKATD